MSAGIYAGMVLGGPYPGRGNQERAIGNVLPGNVRMY